MVMALIAAGGHAAWVRVLVYVTVVVTVLSGADYFFGIRRHLAAAAAARGRPQGT
jgi:CDP-diacylglycerol--glycerol-3-phosphate 3-phosphatidyltransferase